MMDADDVVGWKKQVSCGLRCPIITISTSRSCLYPFSFTPSPPPDTRPSPSPHPFYLYPSDTELTAEITKLHKEGKKAAKGKKDNGSNLF